MTKSQTSFGHLFSMIKFGFFFFEYLCIEFHFEDRYISINLMVVAQRGLKMDTFPLGRDPNRNRGLFTSKDLSPLPCSSGLQLQKENLKRKKRKSGEKVNLWDVFVAGYILEIRSCILLCQPGSRCMLSPDPVSPHFGWAPQAVAGAEN